MTKAQITKSLNKVLTAIEDTETRKAVKLILPDLKTVLGLDMPLDDAIEDAEVTEFKEKAKLKGGAYFYGINGKYCAFKAKSMNLMREFRGGLSDTITEEEAQLAMYHFFLVKEVSDPIYTDFDSEESSEAMLFIIEAFATKKGKAL